MEDVVINFPLHIVILHWCEVNWCCQSSQQQTARDGENGKPINLALPWYCLPVERIRLISDAAGIVWPVEDTYTMIHNHRLDVSGPCEYILPVDRRVFTK